MFASCLYDAGLSGAILGAPKRIGRAREQGVKACASDGTGVTFVGAAPRKSELGWYGGVGLCALCLGRQR